MEMSADDGMDAIRELVARLVEGGRLAGDLREAVESAVLARERTMSTAVGNAVAIPHAKCPGVPELLAVLGISRGGIDFAAADGGLVRLVVLLVVPAEAFRQHLGSLSEVARALSHSAVCESILKADSAEAVIEAVRSAEDG